MDGIKSTSSGRDHETAKQSDRRKYLFEEVIMFFIQYGRVIGPNGAAIEEVDIIKSTYAAITPVCTKARQFSGWTDREQILK